MLISLFLEKINRKNPVTKKKFSFMNPVKISSVVEPIAGLSKWNKYTD